MEKMAMNPAFWSGKKVFITGHTGFKGSWLCLCLQSMGANVSGYSLLPPTSPSLFDIAKIGTSMHSIKGDIRDVALLESSMRECMPDVVIHMAAQSLVRTSYLDPVETYSTNVMGTVHVLEAVKKIPDIKVMINVTSDKCYRNREWIWAYRECDELGGRDPYSNSKSCAELITSAYRDSFFATSRTAIASVRAGNVIGGGDWAVDRLIPDIMRALLDNKAVIIRNPHAIRPWQHVLEPLSGYMLLAQKIYEGEKSFADGWNFGSNEDDARPVNWIADQLMACWDSSCGWKADNSHAQPHEATYLKLDSTKAKQLLGWSPRWSLDVALHKTADWYKAAQGGSDMRAFSIKQIDDYLSAPGINT